MADIKVVADAIAARLMTIQALKKAYTEPPGSIDATPAAVVYLGGIDYDSTMSRGTDDLTFVIDLFFSTHAQGLEHLYGFLSGSGDNSIVKVFADEPTLGGAVNYIMVSTAGQPDRVEVGQSEFLHVELTADAGVLGEMAP